MRKAGKCKHFTGVQNKTCKAGVSYQTFRLVTPDERGRTFPLPCLDADCAACDKREYPTQEEIDADKADMERRMNLLARGLSACCEATFNESQVIASGKYKGHGTRYCSKCGKVCFII